MFLSSADILPDPASALWKELCDPLVPRALWSDLSVGGPVTYIYEIPLVYLLVYWFLREGLSPYPLMILFILV